MGKTAILTACGANFTFSNTNIVTINDSANPLTPAIPYPSANVVTGLAGLKVTKITVTLRGFTSSCPGAGVWSHIRDCSRNFGRCTRSLAPG